MKKRLLYNVIASLSVILVAGCGAPRESGHEGHEGHEASAHAGHEEKAHEGETAGAHDAHEGEEAGAHEEEGEITLTPEAMKLAGITLAKAEIGKISASIDLSGEVGFNEDRLVHITPRFPGIVKEARFRIGEFVNAGETVAVIESNESMTPYSLKTSISGRIIEKHAAPGEHVSAEESIYMLADLSNVWVNLAVYPKDAATVKPGQKAAISMVGTDIRAEGVIRYLTPVMDPQTRRLTARVVLPNNDNAWRPGSFVNAHIEAGEGEAGLIVDKNAVQTLGDKNVVFVQHEPCRFKPVEVVTGESDSRSIRIQGGLEPGAEYVNNGGFELKAKIVTSSLGGHAGHGH